MYIWKLKYFVTKWEPIVVIADTNAIYIIQAYTST